MRSTLILMSMVLAGVASIQLLMVVLPDSPQWIVATVFAACLAGGFGRPFKDYLAKHWRKTSRR